MLLITILVELMLNHTHGDKKVIAQLKLLKLIPSLHAKALTNYFPAKKYVIKSLSLPINWWIFSLILKGLKRLW